MPWYSNRSMKFLPGKRRYRRSKVDFPATTWDAVCPSKHTEPFKEVSEVQKSRLEMYGFLNCSTLTVTDPGLPQTTKFPYTSTKLISGGITNPAFLAPCKRSIRWTRSNSENVHTYVGDPATTTSTLFPTMAEGASGKTWNFASDMHGLQKSPVALHCIV